MAATRVFGACSRALMAAAAKGAAASGVKTSSAAAKTKTKTTATTTTGRGNALQKIIPVSPQLGRFLGAPEASRVDAVKKVWEYIKLHNLQNPANKREIVCDDKLKSIFDGKEKISFTEIARYLSNHFVKSS